MQSQQNFYLQDLLFYDLSSRKKRLLGVGLKEYLFLLSSAQQAFAALQKKEFFSFDPVVGENACQIRAIWLAINLPKHLNAIQTLQPFIAQAEEKTRYFLSILGKLEQDRISLKNLLETHKEMQIHLTRDEFFILQSYLLTVGRLVKPPKEEAPTLRNEVTAPHHLKVFGDITTRFADRLIRYVRKIFSKMSVEFMREQAFDAESRRMTSESFTIATGEPIRYCIPYFWSFKIALSTALRYQIPLILRSKQQAKNRRYETVHEDFLFFRAIPGIGYQPAVPTPAEFDKMALIFEGVTCRDSSELLEPASVKKEILSEDVVDLILACGATHRQFLDPAKELLIQEFHSPSYQAYKKKGLMWGCSLENPHLFFINHIYCTDVKHGMRQNVSQGDNLVAWPPYFHKENFLVSSDTLSQSPNKTAP